MTDKEQAFWRSIIRVLATTTAAFGLMLLFGEVLENVLNNHSGICGSVHLVPMLWGVGMVVGGCLILQKGDVSLSLKEITDAGTIVRGWGRRSYDRITNGKTVIEEHKVTEVSQEEPKP